MALRLTWQGCARFPFRRAHTAISTFQPRMWQLISQRSAFVTPTNSVAGGVKISGRIVETGVYKLRRLGVHPKNIIHGYGSVPIPTIHPKSARAMGRTNDALYCGGDTYYTVTFENIEKLRKIVLKAPSSTAREYGKPFYEVFKATGFDFYKIDPNLFAPAVVLVNNVRTGLTFRSGQINDALLKDTMAVTTG